MGTLAPKGVMILFVKLGDGIIVTGALGLSTERTLKEDLFILNQFCFLRKLVDIAADLFRGQAK